MRTLQTRLALNTAKFLGVVGLLLFASAGTFEYWQGPYRLLRHPMYAGTLLMGLPTSLLLGSYWAALLLPPGLALLVVRILAEERLLSRELPGYADYASRTRSRLIPGVW